MQRLGQGSSAALAGEPEGPGITRRTALQVAALGLTAIALRRLLKPAVAGAAGTTAAPSNPGVYSLNQNWLFGGAYTPGAEATSYSEGSFTAVTIPHVVAPLSWGDWQAASWQNQWIYRRHISGSVRAGNRVFVDFDAVMTSATVYLNGVQIAQHQGGYLPFSVELTHGLTGGDNVLALVVDATWQQVPPDGNSGGAHNVDYLEPGGIYRDVFLRLVPSTYILDVFASPADVLSASPSVGVQFTLDAGAVPSQPVNVLAELMDGATTLGSATGSVTIADTGTITSTLTISGLSGVTLWSPDNPKLYGVRVSIVADGVSHELEINTGFREATFVAGQGFYLNGERVEIFGLNRHGLFPYTGMAGAERLQRRDVELLKELNCNMVRCSHYPQSPYFLDACDELGLMVWQEPPGWQYVGGTGFQQLVVQNVHDMVIRDRNRPSVIVWATRLNETSDDPNLYAETRQVANTLDGSRQTTGAVDYQNTSQFAEDVYAYDDYHSSGGNATLEPPLSGVPYLVSEAVGALDGAPLYRWIDPGATLQLQATLHAQVHNIAQSNPAGYAGLLAWAGFDYASLSGGNRIWHNIKWPGVIDTFRVPKPAAGFYESQGDPGVTPVIVPMFFWDFGASSPSGGPGSNAMIATNCDTLKLYIGGSDTPVATATPDTTDYGSLAYPPVFVDLTVSDSSGSPDLRIDGYRNGVLVSSLSMSSDTSKDQLALTIDDTAITADGTDATRFTLRALDRYGNHRPNPTGDVSLTLTGPATLLSDNPFPFEELGGVGGGFIRSRPGGVGTATLTATHPTLGTASASLALQAASAGPVSSGLPGPRLIGAAVAPPASSGSGGTSVSPASTTTTRSATTPTPATGSETLRVVSKASVRAALASLVVPGARALQIEPLLRKGFHEASFRAPAAGHLVVHWYADRPRGRTSGKSGRILVASGSARVRQAELVGVKIKLTAEGRKLLAHALHERLRVTASFTPTGQPTVTASGSVSLKR